ncbi:hypothetical protein D3C80_1732440 [compost metagenome]
MGDVLCQVTDTFREIIRQLKVFRIVLACVQLIVGLLAQLLDRNNGNLRGQYIGLRIDQIITGTPEHLAVPAPPEQAVTSLFTVYRIHFGNGISAEQHGIIIAAKQLNGLLQCPGLSLGGRDPI